MITIAHPEQSSGELMITMTLTLLLNVDVINMSDAHPSLRSCLYKQTATYYFIEALVHEIGFKICQNH